MFDRKMGNSQTLSSLSVVHEHLQSGRISLHNERGDFIIQELDNLLENATDISADVQAVNKTASSKEIKILSQIAVLLSTEFAGKQPATVSSPSVVRACKVKAVAAVYRLIGIPAVAKLAVEACIPALITAMEKAEDTLFSLLLTCLCTMIFSVDDETFKVKVCLQLEKSGFYDLLVRIFVNVATFKNKSTTTSTSTTTTVTSLYYPLLVASEHLVWLLSDTSIPQSSSGLATSFRALQSRVACLLWKSPTANALFELARHEDRTIRFAITVVTIQSMSLLDFKQCAAIQVTRSNAYKNCVCIGLISCACTETVLISPDPLSFLASLIPPPPSFFLTLVFSLPPSLPASQLSLPPPSLTCPSTLPSSPSPFL